MSRYGVLVCEERTEEKQLTLIVEAADAETAQHDVQHHLDQYVYSLDELCTAEHQGYTHIPGNPHLWIASVELLPEPEDPNQIALFPI